MPAMPCCADEERRTAPALVMWRRLRFIAICSLFVVGCGGDEAPRTDAPCEGADCSDADAGVGADTADPIADATEDAPPNDAEVPDSGVPTETDTDGDGIPDAIEGLGDPDGDGVPNLEDDDSDGDGIPDAVEGRRDADGDGVANSLDLDSDDDGIPDATELRADPDADGIPAYLDSDSDNDGLPDADEGVVDSDGDESPDYLDIDSDNDNISDGVEGLADVDADGVPNYLDEDSDGDGWTDAQEYGQAVGSGAPPADRDGDREPDYLDSDSDADGLGDAIELGCPDSTDRLLADSDDDDIPDLLEVAFAGEDDADQACDPNEQIDDDVDFYFELRFRGAGQRDELVFAPDVNTADILFQMDTTGSMGGEIDELQNSLSSVILPALQTQLRDSAFGVSYFEDFPCSGHGSTTIDRPFRLAQRITTDGAVAQAAVDRLSTNSGNDIPESGLEALYQAATGFGRDNPECIDGPEVEPFNPAVGFVDGVADGTIGGAGFRDGSVPIIVHITDAESHAKGEDNYLYGATRVEAYNALSRIGGKVVGMASGASARSDLEQISIATGSTVPPCAWDLDRPADCPPDACCTAADGAGNPARDGACPLVYDISASGGGLDATIVSGIRVLAEFATFQVNARTRPDPEETRFDTDCFLRRVTPVEGSAPDRACTGEPAIVDINRDGTPDVFDDVSPGASLTFVVDAENDCWPATRDPQVFTAFIDVVGQGAAVLDTRTVTILVPPDVKL